MQDMQKYTKYAKYAKQSIICKSYYEKCSKYAEYDLHTNFAGEELDYALRKPGVELWVK